MDNGVDYACIVKCSFAICMGTTIGLRLVEYAEPISIV